MVLVCGDTHGTDDIHKLRHLKTDCEIGRIKMTKQDYVIVCGDFGLLWNYELTGRSIGSNTNDWCWDDEEIKLLDWYDSCPWTTLVVLGNHENYRNVHCTQKSQDVFILLSYKRVCLC